VEVVAKNNPNREDAFMKKRCPVKSDVDRATDLGRLRVARPDLFTYRFGGPAIG